MAKNTEFPSPGSDGLVRGVLYVRLGGSVASFARDGLMIALVFLGHLVDVAGTANRGSGKSNRFCDFSFDRRTTVKLPVDQRGRKDDKSDRDNRRNDSRDDNGESFDLLRDLFQRQPTISRASILDQHPDLRCRFDSGLFLHRYHPERRWLLRGSQL
jgi:hypothetical protein